MASQNSVAGDISFLYSHSVNPQKVPHGTSLPASYSVYNKCNIQLLIISYKIYDGIPVFCF
jgi:hypothetical protein